MWQRTNVSKQITIEGKHHTVTQLMATENFTIAGRVISAHTLGGWLCAQSSLPQDAWCDENSYIVDSHLTGKLYIERSHIVEATVHTFSGQCKDVKLFYSQLQSDTLTLIGNMTLTALRTVNAVCEIHATGTLMDCAFHGNLNITGSFEMITSEWRGRSLQLSGHTHWQRVHTMIQQGLFEQTTCKQFEAHVEHLKLSHSTCMNVELHGRQMAITEATWHDVDISIATLTLSASEIDDVLLFSPLGTLVMTAPIIYADRFNVHHEKINVTIQQDTPLHVTKDILY